MAKRQSSDAMTADMKRGRVAKEVPWQRQNSDDGRLAQIVATTADLQRGRIALTVALRRDRADKEAVLCRGRVATTDDMHRKRSLAELYQQ